TGKIEFCNFSVKYRPDTKIILKNLTFTIKSGEKIGVVGRTGSGKSTLGKILVGLYKIFDGCINYLNNNTVQTKISMVIQNPDNAIIGKTVEEELAFSLQNLDLTYDQMHQQFNEIIKLMNLEKYVKSDINVLSGGIKQKVSIASCLISNPNVLILDEIKNQLDLYEQKYLDEVIYDLWKIKNKTLILISHDLNDIFDANQIFYLNSKHEFFKFKDPFLFIDFLYENKLDEKIQIPDFIKLKKALNLDLRLNYDETLEFIFNQNEK
ncbi:MAG: ABC transporter ATP-binding protein, partial [Mycoplasmataceae bacterium]|nr:ABC transporter ATP-binding protein [Mycoplasmataceae bacterium]